MDVVTTIGDDNVEIVRIDVPALLVGKTVHELTVPGVISVVSINRDYHSFIPTLGTQFNSNDIIYIAVLATAIGKLKSLLGLS